MKHLALALTVGLACSAMGQLAETLWTYSPPSGYVDASPAIGDITGDGQPEIIIGTVSGLVVALDLAGEELWQYEMRGPICVPPSMGHLTERTAPEVVVMNQQGQIRCLAGDTGRELWSASLPGRLYWGETTLALADLTGDGLLEVVTGDAGGAVACFRGAGELLWLHQGDHGVTRAPAIADLTGDGALEILISGDLVPLVCLAADGRELWRLPDGVGGSPLIYDITGDGAPEILLGIDENLTALDATGALLWTYPMRREMDSALSVADANGDGQVEIYAVDLVGHFVCLSPQGQARWTASVEERVRRSPSIGDVDGDGTPDILVAGYSGAIHVFDPEGRLKERIPVPGNTNSTATIVPLGDAGPGVLLPLASEALQMLHWPEARADAQLLWPEYRFDSRRTGWPESSVAEIPVTLDVLFGALYAGANLMQVTVENPEERTITVRLAAQRNTEAPVVFVKESNEISVNHQLSYIVPADRAVNLVLSAEVFEGERILARRSHTVYLPPFVKEINDAAALLADVEATLPTLIDHDGLMERAHFLRYQSDMLSARVVGAGALPEEKRLLLRDELAGLLRDIHALRQVVDGARLAAAADTTTLLFSANPWAPFGGIEEITEGRTHAPAVHVESFGGEQSAAALNLFNMSSRTRTFRVELEALTLDDTTVTAHEVITLHEVLDIPTEMRDLSADALPKLNTANTLQTPAWGARQLWLNINTAHLTPGDWTGTVRLRSLDVVPVELEASLTLSVWPAQLPEEQALRLCHWGYVHRSMLRDFPEEALADQVRNRTNVFVGLFHPQAQYDETGTLVGDIDFTEHDAYVKRHAPHGKILFFNYQHALKGPDSMDSEAYRKAHVQWLRVWVERLRELGLGYEDFALYPVDEPGLSEGLVERQLLMGKLAREADPDILLYTDPVGRITEEELRMLLPYVDIWCPHRDGLILEPSNAGKLDIILNSGGALWTYECAGNAKHQSPLGYYRAQAWLAWEYNLTGIGFWSYCTSRDDPWFTPGHRHDYLMTYPGNGVVTSKRWEAVRDGVEDYMMLGVLRDALATPPAGVRPEDLERAKRLLDEDAAAVAQFCGFDEAGTLLSAENPARARRVADERWETIKTLRREIARLLNALK